MGGTSARLDTAETGRNRWIERRRRLRVCRQIGLAHHAALRAQQCRDGLGNTPLIEGRLATCRQLAQRLRKRCVAPDLADARRTHTLGCRGISDE